MRGHDGVFYEILDDDFTTGHIFFLNDDMELNRYGEPFVQKMLKKSQSQLK